MEAMPWTGCQFVFLPVSMVSFPMGVTPREFPSAATVLRRDLRRAAMLSDVLILLMVRVLSGAGLNASADMRPTQAIRAMERVDGIIDYLVWYLWWLLLDVMVCAGGRS